MHRLIVLLLLVISGAGSFGADRVPAKIKSISVCMHPTIFFGGFAFYADRGGNAFAQEYSGGEATKQKERRVMLRKRPELFQGLLKTTNLNALLSKPTGRKYGEPDEVRITVEIELTNDVHVTVRKWIHEQSRLLDSTIDLARKLGEAALKEPSAQTIEAADPTELNQLQHRFEED